ncbi:MAG: tRNA 2-thiocytidine(32) synthetase TtcA [Deltaproteobacteria bacterium]|nr:tRNA 2-thiocytidine(32) synthetase TtcA [Deltaproteobacteria bacterium]
MQLTERPLTTGPHAPRTPDAKLEKRLLRDTGRAIAAFDLIAPGDKILVGISGGKDSFTLLYLLQQLQRRAPVPFELIACNLDQGHPGFPAAQLEAYLRAQDVPVRMLKEDTFSIVKRLVPEGETTCSVCSRLRRGILYTAARELGCTKIALGHHRDDLIESLLMSMLFAGKTRSMPPKLVSDDGRNTVIRPLVYCSEKDIAAFAQSAQFPIIPCDLCGSQENLQRKRVKTLLNELEREHPDVRNSLQGAMGNVMPLHLLDARLQALEGTAQAASKDPWIDEDDCGPKGGLTGLGQR